MSFVVHHAEADQLARRSHEPASLRQILPAASFVGCANIRVHDATESPHDCAPGTLFVPPRRPDATSEADAARAIANGASALLVARPRIGLPVPQCVVPNVRRAYSRICAALVDEPLRRLRTAAIAATHGSEAVLELLRSILSRPGHPCGVISSSAHNHGGESLESASPVCCPKTFWNAIAETASRGAEFVVIELTGGAIEADWIPAVDVAGIMHLNRQLGCRGNLFERDLARCLSALELPRAGGTIIANGDDSAVGTLRARLPDQVEFVTVGVNRPALIATRRSDEEFSSLVAIQKPRIKLPQEAAARHGLLPCLVAAAVAQSLGLCPDEIDARLRAAPADAEPTNYLRAVA